MQVLVRSWDKMTLAIEVTPNQDLHRVDISFIGKDVYPDLDTRLGYCHYWEGNTARGVLADSPWPFLTKTYGKITIRLSAPEEEDHRFGPYIKLKLGPTDVSGYVCPWWRGRAAEFFGVDLDEMRVIVELG